MDRGPARIPTHQPTCRLDWNNGEKSRIQEKLRVSKPKLTNSTDGLINWEGTFELHKAVQSVSGSCVVHDVSGAKPKSTYVDHESELVTDSFDRSNEVGSSYEDVGIIGGALSDAPDPLVKVANSSMAEICPSARGEEEGSHDRAVTNPGINSVPNPGIFVTNPATQVTTTVFGKPLWKLIF